MRPKTKKHTHFITHRQQKIPRTKPQKRKNKQQPFIVVFLSHSRPLYSSHTTHHPTHNTHQGILLYQRGDFIEQQPCCSRHPTACQTTKQTRTQTHLLLCKTPPTGQPAEKAPLCFIDSQNHTHEVCVILVFT